MGNRFFLGQAPGLPLSENRGLFPTQEWISRRPWNDGDTANLCIGQGNIAVTPVQMAVMTSAVANGGKVFKPRLVKRVEPFDKVANPEDIEEFETELRGNIKVHANNLRVIQNAMLADTEDPEGSGYHAFNPGGRRKLNHFRVGGKTGTAQVIGPGFKDYVTWFVSFGPIDSPRYAVVVVIESGSSGGITCAPISQKVFQDIEQIEAGQTPQDQVAGL
jgi:penicillin-binding protein 2